jgi:ATP-dependent DNA helicase
LFYWPWGDKEPDETLVTESGKMMLLDRLVKALFERGHKVLIFSQFSRMLDIIEEWAETLRGWPVCRIDGAVSQEDRREQIRRFNKDEGWKLFLLSTRAGGLGINVSISSFFLQDHTH